MDGAAAEHLKEAVPVLARYCQAVALRSFPGDKNWDEDKLEPFLCAFRKYAGVPVINMESATGHPCQALADIIDHPRAHGAARKEISLNLGASCQEPAHGGAGFGGGDRGGGWHERHHRAARGIRP